MEFAITAAITGRYLRIRFGEPHREFAHGRAGRDLGVNLGYILSRPARILGFVFRYGTCCKMRDAMTVEVTMFPREAHGWHLWPWHSEILNHLHAENVYAATVPHRVGGFLGRQPVWTSQLVDAGGKLPVILISVDADGHLKRLVPTLKEMAAHRLVAREQVVLEQGTLD